ncbi:fused DSP-PTPase phosphatase/NAD kinase-like protein [Azospirillum thermophilum]|nr:sulfur transferase domain-containing protein [Azospirillum thermophilum]
MAKKWFIRRYTTAMADGIKRGRGRMVSRWQRALGHFEAIFIDHACFRLIYSNTYRISPNMFRASQPSPSHIAAAARAGVKTILNLRGSRDCASYILEAEACRAHGLTLVDFPVNSRDMPKKETLLKARELFRKMEYPALMHCKSGADRAGFMAALYMFVHEGQPLEAAVRQLSWKYGHFKQAKTGILDYFFELYAAYNERRPTPFWDWVEHVYDPVEAKAGFRSREWANVVVDRVLSRE